MIGITLGFLWQFGMHGNRLTPKILQKTVFLKRPWPLGFYEMLLMWRKIRDVVNFEEADFNF